MARDGIHQEQMVDTRTLCERIIGWKQLTNWGGIGILSFDNAEDKVTFRYYYGDYKASRKHTCKIRYTNKNGYPYFITANNRQHLSDFMKTDIGVK